MATVTYTVSYALYHKLPGYGFGFGFVSRGWRVENVTSTPLGVKVTLSKKI